MSRNAIPIISSLEDGPPYEAFVITNPVEIDDICTDGRVLVRCHHKHRDTQTARSCAERLFQRRCPVLYRCREAASVIQQDEEVCGVS